MSEREHNQTGEDPWAHVSSGPTPIYRSNPRPTRPSGPASQPAAPTSTTPSAFAQPPLPLTPPHRRSRKGLIVVLVIALVVALCGGAWYLYAFRQNHAGLHDLGDRPADSAGTNILLIGSDNRGGANAAYGKNVEGERGDVTILLHVSGDGKSATIVGIPRDSIVNQPSCTTESGRVMPAEQAPFNAAYARGGISCTVKTFEQLTRIRVDHFVVVDFTGFKNMVDALGTVSICLPKAVNDPDSGLNLPAGRQEVGGEDALAYVRMRYGLGDGSDLARVKRQQAFLAAVAQKATSSDTVTNPVKLTRFIRAATGATTVDEDFSNAQMISLANTLNSIGLNNINFVTLPTRPHPTNTNWVDWTASANALWAQLSNDTYKPGDEQPSNQPSSQPSSSGAIPVVKIAPDAVHVQILNGTGKPGLAASAQQQMQAMGFTVTSTGTAAGSFPTTVVRHRPDMAQSAATVVAAIPGAVAQSTPGMGATMQVVLGNNFTSLQKIIVKASTEHVKVRKAAEDICS